MITKKEVSNIQICQKIRTDKLDSQLCEGTNKKDTMTLLYYKQFEILKTNATATNNFIFFSETPPQRRSYCD